MSIPATSAFSAGLFASRGLKFWRHPRFRLRGTWRGAFKPSHNNGHIKLNASLMVTVHGHRLLDAVLHYEGVHENEVIYRGFDQAENCSEHSIDVAKQRWNPVFVNRCHQIFNEQFQSQTNLQPRPLQTYSWQCYMTDRWTQMHIEVSKPDDHHIDFTGDLTKQ